MKPTTLLTLTAAVVHIYVAVLNVYPSGVDFCNSDFGRSVSSNLGYCVRRSSYLGSHALSRPTHTYACTYVCTYELMYIKHQPLVGRGNFVRNGSGFKPIFSSGALDFMLF
jgi:hypothetical protein